jgi:hypothetical protein
MLLYTKVKHLPPSFHAAHTAELIYLRDERAYSFGRGSKAIVSCNDGKSTKSKVVHQEEISRQNPFFKPKELSLVRFYMHKRRARGRRKLFKYFSGCLPTFFFAPLARSTKAFMQIVEE